MAVRKVTIIPAKTRRELYSDQTKSAKERVAAYCRVSTNNEEQETSFEFQKSYFEMQLSRQPMWDNAGIYADEGISGKSVKNRKDFQRMLADCRQGKIDKIVTKSISRFARNGMECKKYVLELKELGIGVYFEKEQLDSLAVGSDLILSILSSVAEQESRDISTNVKWTYEKKYKRGEVVLNTTRFLGYTKDDQKKIIIVPEEAETVRRIYREFVGGKTYKEIGRGLESDNIMPPSYGCGDENKKCDGKNWHASTIRSILINEKYKGDAMLQKSYNVDFLSKRRKNEGQVDSVYVEDCIPAIVSKELADLVELEIKKRSGERGASESGRGRYSSKYPFSGLLFCGNDNAKLRRHCQWSGDKRTPIWICTHKAASKGNDCDLLPIKETVLEQAFVEAIRRLFVDRDEFIDILTNNIESSLKDDSSDKIRKLEALIEVKSKYMLEINDKYRQAAISREEYAGEFERTSLEMDILLKEKKEMLASKLEFAGSNVRLSEMKEFLAKTKNITEFDAELLINLVARIKVMSKHNIVFEFKCGFEYEMSI